MKKLFFTLCFIYASANFASAQSHTPGSRDTQAVNHRVSVREPANDRDTVRYDNPVYRNGIRQAEYQNRGAEDRRNPHSADPNAIPNKRVPDKQRAAPVK